MLMNMQLSNLLKPQAQPCLEKAEAIRVCRTRLMEVLERLERLATPETADLVLRLREELDDFAVRISLIGQVKAGKTAMTNALIGSPNLLPSDVNPWTSVITSVHMNTKQPLGKNAVFTFFTTEEWDKMVTAGGYLGEVAERANHQDELTELREQIALMQARTRTRLGKNFNMLLDGYHSFLGFSPELIKKYVCLGEDEEDQNGRYADVTRSASLYIENKNYLLPTEICDTPGVNDPFLLREAVTLDNLSNTDICVVVLSAHQAFSTVDIGLLRILIALKHKELVLYVNRIDELQDPDRQIIEIDSFIREIFEEQNMPKDIPIVFGSAAWAEVATLGASDKTDATSAPKLAAFAQARRDRLAQMDLPEPVNAKPGTSLMAATKTSDLSGLYELRQILQDKSATNIGLPVLETVRARALDVSRQSLLYLEQLGRSESPLAHDLDFDKFFDYLDETLKEADEACAVISKELSNKVLFLMSSAFRDFMINGKASLKAHIAAKKPIGDWRPDSDKLRRDLNLAHDEFVVMAPQRVRKVLDRAAARIQKVYGIVLDDHTQLFAVTAPVPEAPKTPVSLMRTMAVEMNTGWFSSWFTSRFNQDSLIKKFETISHAEMQATLKEMQDVYVHAFLKQIRLQLHSFLSEHIRTLQNLSLLGGDTQRDDVLRQLGVDTEIRQRVAELGTVVADLENLFARSKDSDAPLNKSVA